MADDPSLIDVPIFTRTLAGNSFIIGHVRVQSDGSITGNISDPILKGYLLKGDMAKVTRLDAEVRLIPDTQKAT